MWRCSCFGFSLRKNVLVLAAIDVIIAIVSLTLGTIGLVNVWNHRDNLTDHGERISRSSETTKETQDEFEVQIIIAFIVIVILTVHLAFYAMNIILGVYLWYATIKKSREKCHAWFTITFVIWVISLISFFISLISFKGHKDPTNGSSHSYFSTMTSVFNILYKAYVLWIVRSYVNLLRVNNARYGMDYNRQSMVEDANEENASQGMLS